MRLCKVRDAKNLVLVDYKSAYNTIDRTKLYERLREKKIFEESEL